MDDLIARLQGLGAPDRDVDLHIMRYVENIGGDWQNALPYTASIDSALTLLPDNCGYVIHQKVGLPPSVAIQFGHEGAPVPTTADGWADYERGATPAIALCIASLRARTGHIEAQGEG